MEALALDWLTFLLRWLHVITAIAWIGASFYFIWLDLSLEPPSDAKRERGLKGELWAIHGGGIYEVGKYESHPKPMPGTLHWFKWEAYSTWITGTLLLIVIYYFKADAYLVGANLWVQTPEMAVLASVGYLGLGLSCYEVMMRFVAKTPGVQLIVMLLLVTGLSFIAFQTFAPRAAILHLGAVLATMMAGNVFLIIIPSQKAFVGAIAAGEAVDPSLGLNAKTRSTHNNYLTLPVLFCMLSNHAAFVYGHRYAWVFVVAFACVAAFARHYFNEKHSGRHKPWILVVAALLFVLLVGVTQVTQPKFDVVSSDSAMAQEEVASLEAQAQVIVSKHCAGCHSEQPTLMGLTAPPGGMIFNTPEQLHSYPSEVTSSVQTQFMPLGNLTGITQEERSALLSYMALSAAEDGT